MRIGVDYYPEHWDEELWTRDAQLMTETGVKLVRLAEFAWCRLEPSDGQFDLPTVPPMKRDFTMTSTSEIPDSRTAIFPLSKPK